MPDRATASTATATVRTGTALVLTGAVAEYAVTTLHPHREAPNDHAGVFAEYAASSDWISVHLGQFAAGLVLPAGFLTLLAGLRAAGAPALVVRVGTAATMVAGAVFTVLQGVDGVALKHAVDSFASAPPELHDVYLHDAEIVRWDEWAMAGYSRITLGLAVAVLAVAVLASGALPRWTAGLALAAGAGFMVDGVLVSQAGFSDQVLASLVGWTALGAFALVTTVAPWVRPRG